MRHTYRKLLLFALAFTFLVGGYTYWKSKIPLRHEATNSTHNNGAISQNTLSLVHQSLAKREYHISYDSTTHVIQSPNRRQAFRTYYEPGRLKVVDRRTTDKSKPILQLTNQGIYADGRLVLAPQPSADIELWGNILQIHHSGFTEEYINDPKGVRQNFIVKSVPAGTRTLQVRLITEGVQIMDSGTNKLSLSRQGLTSETLFRYRDLHCWDAKGQTLSSNLAYVDNQIQLEVDVENATYPVTIDPLIESGDPSNADETLSGDQNYSGWGTSVSSAGDVNNDGYDDVVVGAPYYDLGEESEGVAFVFLGSSTGINADSPITLQINQANAHFGESVANAGDLNNDGFDDVVVGAPFYDHEDFNEGAAFVFLGKADGLNTTSQTQVEGNMLEAHMGFTVSSAGNVNNDPYDDLIVVASKWANNEEIDEGAAFVFHGSQDGIDHASVVALEGNSQFAMTYSASGAGDVNGDGYDDVVVGTMGHTNGELYEGAATVYYGSSTGISINGKSVLEGNQQFGAMGVSVAGVGDINGDGFEDIIVGASEFSNGQSGEGVVFSFYGSSTGISLTASAMLEKDQADADFGHSITGLGDLNGDGYNDIAIGAFHFDNGQGDEGAAFIYFGSKDGLKPTELMFESNQSNALLGASVKSAGDVNDDGINDLIIGAQGFGQNYNGAAFVFHHWDTVLPVKLVSFQANPLENTIELQWTTSEELNSDRFEIQKAVDKSTWISLGDVGASINSNARQDYNFTDINPVEGANIYRLKMIDKDGTFAFSSIKVAQFKKPQQHQAVIYPNPASQGIRIDAEISSIELFSMTGRQVLSVTARRSNEIIDISKLHPGVYSVLVKYQNGSFVTDKILVE